MKYVFTENIDYQVTGKDSIWGKGDKDTLRLLTALDISGKWLNLAAGDGRYNKLLLTKAQMVVAADIDERALAKLKENTPDDLKGKLHTRTFNLLNAFPFADRQFDGVFCTGTLHLFPEKILTKILLEIDRVLKPDGTVIIDFATDIKKVLPNGKPYVLKRIQYTAEEAMLIIRKLLKGYKLKIIQSKVPEEVVRIGDILYTFSCNYLLVVGKK
jgi:SAM-dependent methyltransferase